MTVAMESEAMKKVRWIGGGSSDDVASIFDRLVTTPVVADGATSSMAVHSSLPSSNPAVVEPVRPLKTEVRPVGGFRKWRQVVASMPAFDHSLPVREWTLPVSSEAAKRRRSALAPDIPDKLIRTLVAGRDGDAVQHHEPDKVHHSKSDYPAACGVVDQEDQLLRRFHPKSD
jgi:hypothetical protein